MNHIKLKVLYLPPNCPKIAPIEHVFRAIKAKLRNKSSKKTIDFIKKIGVRTRNEISTKLVKRLGNMCG